MQEVVLFDIRSFSLLIFFTKVVDDPVGVVKDMLNDDFQEFTSFFLFGLDAFEYFRDPKVEHLLLVVEPLFGDGTRFEVLESVRDPIGESLHSLSFFAPGLGADDPAFAQKRVQEGLA